MEITDIENHNEEHINIVEDIEDGADWLESYKNEIDALYIGKLFVSWQEVIVFLDVYCKQRGFGYRKGHLKKNDGNVPTKRTFLCKHAGIYKAKKTATLNETCNKTSCRVNCLWYINISKKAEGVYEVKTFISEH